MPQEALLPEVDFPEELCDVSDDFFQPGQLGNVGSWVSLNGFPHRLETLDANGSEPVIPHSTLRGYLAELHSIVVSAKRTAKQREPNVVKARDKFDCVLLLIMTCSRYRVR